MPPTRQSRFTLGGDLARLIAAPAVFAHSHLPSLHAVPGKVVQTLAKDTHPLVHAVEQPVQGIRHETEEVISGAPRRMVRSLATFWVPVGLGGYLAWRAADHVVPGPKRQLMAMLGVEPERRSKRSRYY